MAAQSHSTSSRTEVVMGETAKGVAQGLILGPVLGLVGGALAGGAIGGLGPWGIGLGIAGAVVGALTAGVGPLMGAAIGIGIPAALGAAAGAITGAGIGTGLGVGFFGVKGAMRGGRKVDEEEQLYARHKEAAAISRGNSLTAARVEAIERTVEALYPIAASEGASMTVNRIIQAQQMKMAEMAAHGKEMTAVDRYCGGKHPKGSHVATAEAAVHNGPHEPTVY